MQEIKKRRIVLASVLKPINDPRMFEKIGQSLAEKYDVHILGFNVDLQEDYPGILFHQLAPFKRLSFSRLLAPFRILKTVIMLKPSLLIICTHELLCVALVSKMLIHCKIVYDVQENYWRNLYYGEAFPFYMRPFIAGYVRVKEWLTAPFLDYFFLAETGYEKEIAFGRHKRTVLENKLKKSGTLTPTKQSKGDGKIHLLFSGTLAETTGVFTAIELAIGLYERDDRIRLLIIGYCAIPPVLAQIKNKIADKSFIELVGGNTIIPHEQILLAIQRSDFGIIAYPPNPSTENSIPTKLYEYLGYQLPILLTDHSPWLTICDMYDAAIPFDPKQLDADGTLGAMQRKTFFSTLPGDVFWDSEEKKLLQSIENVMKDP